MVLIRSGKKRNLLAFWILGLCNNFAYVIMLSAAKDILETENKIGNVDEKCPEDEKDIKCTAISTGSVLLADILPTLFVKLIAPFLLMHIPYDIRHVIVVFCQGLSYVITATSGTVMMGLIGVIFASFGAGLGEITYLSLASHYDSDVISAYSSGTGGAGLVGALVYAVMTDSYMLNISPNKTLLCMIIIPIIFLLCYWKILKCPDSVKQHGMFNNNEGNCYEALRSEDIIVYEEENIVVRDNSLENEVLPLTYEDKKHIIRSMLPYMIPLVIVYYAEYFINQGLFELISFTCKKGFHLTLSAQYRWYQVLYQIGVFISRSSNNIFVIKSKFLPVLAVIQVINLVIFYQDAVHPFINHIIIIMLLVLFEGTIGGKAYVSTFSQIHKKTAMEHREFSLSFVAISDSIGIVMAGFSAIPIHNYICSLRKYS
uniref:Battenin n=1 Tax=Parastrongyloides trichosuri TaxID=131310 RepID=A0A0N4Z2G3_PARTI